MIRIVIIIVLAYYCAYEYGVITSMQNDVRNLRMFDDSLTCYNVPKVTNDNGI